MNHPHQSVLVLGLGESGLAMALWLLRCGASVRVADTRAVPPALAQLQALAPSVEFIAGRLDASLLEAVDLVAVSPGLSPLHDLAEISTAAAEKSIAMIGEIELFAQALAALRSEHAYAPKVIAITGTNGKTTVTRMTGLLCASSGLRTQVAGNISPAVLDVLRQALDSEPATPGMPMLPQVWVLELSSFQLHHTMTLAADAAALLNITQDHLDWHGDLESYTQAKVRVFGAAGNHTVRVLNRDDAGVMAAVAGTGIETVSAVTTLASESVNTITFGTDEAQVAGSFGLASENGVQWLSTAVADVDDDELSQKKRTKQNKDDPASQVALHTIRTMRLMPVEALQVRGRHNAANALAALALCRAIDLPLAPLLHALRAYCGEPHRVELVTVIAGVTYFDDSKGTNVGATVAALVGLGVEAGNIDAADSTTTRRKKLWLIAGGDGKGQDFSPLADPVQRFVHTVLLIGRDAPRIRAALTGAASIASTTSTASATSTLVDCATLDAAVQYAAEHARAGDYVLLSPACASFDMFRGYDHRAQVFVDAVREVALTHGAVMA